MSQITYPETEQYYYIVVQEQERQPETSITYPETEREYRREKPRKDKLPQTYYPGQTPPRAVITTPEVEQIEVYNIPTPKPTVKYVETEREYPEYQVAYRVYKERQVAYQPDTGRMTYGLPHVMLPKTTINYVETEPPQQPAKETLSKVKPLKSYEELFVNLFTEGRQLASSFWEKAPEYGARKQHLQEFTLVTASQLVGFGVGAGEALTFLIRPVKIEETLRGGYRFVRAVWGSPMPVASYVGGQFVKTVSASPQTFVAELLGGVAGGFMFEQGIRGAYNRIRSSKSPRYVGRLDEAKVTVKSTGKGQYYETDYTIYKKRIPKDVYDILEPEFEQIGKGQELAVISKAKGVKSSGYVDLELKSFGKAVKGESWFQRVKTKFRKPDYSQIGGSEYREIEVGTSLTESKELSTKFKTPGDQTRPITRDTTFIKSVKHPYVYDEKIPSILTKVEGTDITTRRTLTLSELQKLREGDDIFFGGKWDVEGVSRTLGKGSYVYDVLGGRKKLTNILDEFDFEITPIKPTPGKKTSLTDTFKAKAKPPPTPKPLNTKYVDSISKTIKEGGKSYTPLIVTYEAPRSIPYIYTASKLFTPLKQPSKIMPFQVKQTSGKTGIDIISMARVKPSVKKVSGFKPLETSITYVETELKPVILSDIKIEPKQTPVTTPDITPRVTPRTSPIITPKIITTITPITPTINWFPTPSPTPPPRPPRPPLLIPLTTSKKRFKGGLDVFGELRKYSGDPLKALKGGKI